MPQPAYPTKSQVVGHVSSSEAVRGTANGPRSWWLHVDGPAQSKLLIQTTESIPELRPGHHVRILEPRIDADPDSTVTVASMNALPEVFRLSPTPEVADLTDDRESGSMTDDRWGVTPDIQCGRSWNWRPGNIQTTSYSWLATIREPSLVLVCGMV